MNRVSFNIESTNFGQKKAVPRVGGIFQNYGIFDELREWKRCAPSGGNTRTAEVFIGVPELRTGLAYNHREIFYPKNSREEVGWLFSNCGANSHSVFPKQSNKNVFRMRRTVRKIICARLPPNR